MEITPTPSISKNDLHQISTPSVLAHNRIFPVIEELAGLFRDGGIHQGSTVEVRGEAETTFAAALTIAVSQSSKWTAVVGLPGLSSQAVSHLGVDLSRWVFVDHPQDHAAEVVQALMGSVALILIGSNTKIRSDHGRKIAARMRSKGTSIITVGDARGYNLRPSFSLKILRASWSGIGHGNGRLTSRRLEVEAVHRGVTSNSHRRLFYLPDEQGQLSAIKQSFLQVDPVASRDVRKQGGLQHFDEDVPQAS